MTHEKQLHPLGPPEGPRHNSTVASYDEAVSYEQGTPVNSSVQEAEAYLIGSVFQRRFAEVNSSTNPLTYPSLSLI